MTRHTTRQTTVTLEELLSPTEFKFRRGQKRRKWAKIAKNAKK